MEFGGPIGLSKLSLWQSLDRGPQEAAALQLLIRLRHALGCAETSLSPWPGQAVHSELRLEHTLQREPRSHYQLNCPTPVGSQQERWGTMARPLPSLCAQASLVSLQ